MAHHVADKIAFDFAQCVRADAIHIVPEALAGQLRGLDTQGSGEDGGVKPLSDGIFGARFDTAVEGGDQEIGADRDGLSSFGDVVVDDVGEVELFGGIQKSGAGAEFMDEDFFGGRLGVECGDDVFDAAEVFLPDDFGFAVDAFGLTGVVVGVAFDFFGGDAWHG